MHIAPLKRSDVEKAKRVIATVVLEYYFDSRLSPDELLVRYEKDCFMELDLSQRPDRIAGGN